MQDNGFNPMSSATGMHSMPKNSLVKGVIIPSVVILIIILAGVGTGWMLSKNTSKKAVVGNNVSNVDKAPGAEVSNNGNEVGINDTQTFSDTATGTLQEGGIEGEGSHHLERPGGANQTVYITSSVVDLDQFVGKKVTVWGQTLKGKKAGWLMDVGRVKIEE